MASSHLKQGVNRPPGHKIIFLVSRLLCNFMEHRLTPDNEIDPSF